MLAAAVALMRRGGAAEKGEVFFMEKNRLFGRNLYICLTVLIFIVSALLLTGCGSGSTAASGNMAVAETAAAPDFDSAQEAASEGSGSVGALMSEQQMAGTADDAGVRPEAQDTRKLIRTVSVEAETEQFDELIKTVDQKVSDLDGYIESMDSYAPTGDDTYGTRYTYMTVRIPADRLDEFIDTALSGARIRRKSENTQDVTLQYTDIDARLRTLRIEQERLMELLAEAETTDNLIALEQRLSEIRYEIESLSSQLRVYDNQVSYSTIDMSIYEVRRITATADDGFLAQVRSGFSENLQHVSAFLRACALFILTALPILLPVAALLLLVYSMFKMIRRKRMPKSLDAL